jgi:hypothetical protein
MNIYSTQKQMNDVLQLLDRRAKFQGESQTELSARVAAILLKSKNQVIRL